MPLLTSQAVPGGEDEDGHLHGYGEPGVLAGYAYRAARYLDCTDNLQRPVVHYHHVGSLDSRIATDTAHSYSDVGAGQNRCVVDAVADKSESSSLGLRLQQFLDVSDLIGRKKLGWYSSMPILRAVSAAITSRSPVSITVLSTPRAFQVSYGLGRIVLYLVGNDDMTGIDSVDGYVDNGANKTTASRTLADGYSERLHHLLIAHRYASGR